MAKGSAGYDLVLLNKVFPWLILVAAQFGFYVALLTCGSEYPVLGLIYANMMVYLLSLWIVGVIYSIFGKLHHSYRCKLWGERNVVVSSWGRFGDRLCLYSIFCIVIELMWGSDYVQVKTTGILSFAELQYCSTLICGVCCAMCIGIIYMYLVEMGRMAGEQDGD